jgi:hypothetical protein
MKLITTIFAGALLAAPASADESVDIGMGYMIGSAQPCGLRLSGDAVRAIAVFNSTGDSSVQIETIANAIVEVEAGMAAMTNDQLRRHCLMVRGLALKAGVLLP